MDDEQILKLVLDKALSNAYKSGSIPLSLKYIQGSPIEPLIFSHDFAKAFWGDGMCMKGSDSACEFDHPHWSWEDHLQQMVLESEPLKYLEKFL